MGFNPPVPQQDSNWEIRVALLMSLLLQVLLIFLGPMRQRSTTKIPRFIIWSCYLLADWVADLGLGLILNNMGNIGGGGGNSTSTLGLKRGGGGGTMTNTAGNSNSSSNDAGSGSPIIFAFWTPFLLLHLGGPDTITAYSLEDNNLWLRHLVGLLFELFSACIIFFCSLRGNPLIHATVLMFVVGIIKYAERTYSLYSGSVDGFRNKILDPPETGRNYAKFMTEFDSKEKAGLVVEIAIPNDEASKVLKEQKEMEKEETMRLVLNSNKSVEAWAYKFFLIFRRRFVNHILSFKERRLSQTFFLERKETTPTEAFKVIEVELNFIYDMVYTKASVAYTRQGWVLRCICSCCLVSALIIFFFLDKPGHQIQRVDVGVTYALLLGGLALDVAALLRLLFSDRAKIRLEESRRFKWLAQLTRAVKRWRTQPSSRMVAQFNLITYFLGVPDSYGCIRRCCLMVANKTLKFVGADLSTELPLLQDLIFIDHQSLRIKYRTQDSSSAYIEESQLLNAFFDSIKLAALQLTGKDYLEIEEVFSRRGSLVLDGHKNMIIERQRVTEGDKLFSVIRDSMVSKDFEESLLLWHIATDLCLLRDYPGPMAEDDASRMQAISKTLSEYMLYLLIKQPEMLSARTGAWLMRDTCAEARRFFGFMKAWIGSHEDARRMLLSVNTSVKPCEVKGDESLSVLFDAVILAKALRELNEELMWEIVAGVWMEMLIYAARKCPGSTHVQQLNHGGGELITIIWLLMEHMGLGDMYNIRKVDAVAKIIVHDH